MKTTYKSGRDRYAALHAKEAARGNPKLDEYFLVPVVKDGRRPFVYEDGSWQIGSKGAYFKPGEAVSLLRAYRHDPRQQFVRVPALDPADPPSRMQVVKWVKMTKRDYLRHPF